MKTFQKLFLTAVFLIWGVVIVFSFPQDTQERTNEVNEEILIEKIILEPTVYQQDAFDEQMKEHKFQKEKEAIKLAKEKKLQEEKKLAEAKKIAEEKHKAELIALRDAKNKAKLEAQKNKQVVTVSRSNSRTAQTYVYEITAYTAGVESTGKRKGDKGYGQTASGAYVQEGVTIACPKDFAFGTKVEIEGYGIRVCQDTGSAIGSGKIDLYMESLYEAKQFGRQKIAVKIYR